MTISEMYEHPFLKGERPISIPRYAYILNKVGLTRLLCLKNKISSAKTHKLPPAISSATEINQKSNFLAILLIT